MGSYNRLNGAYVCESPEILSIPREVWGWRGFYCPDFLFAVRDPRAALEAGLDLGALGGDGGRTRRMLEEAHPDLLRAGVANVARALIGSGVADHPADPSPEVSSSEHRDLATRTTVAGTVLLRNTGLLPLAESVRSVAVIGPAGADAFPVGGGAASVSLTPDRITWPLEAIQERACGRLLVRHAQGSLGDVPLPLVPGAVLTTPDGEPGVLVEFDDGTRRIVPHVDHRAEISDLGAPWPSRWRNALP